MMNLQTYIIESLGHHDLPKDLARASEANVEDVLRRAAAHLGFSKEVVIERVASVLGGSCIASVDVVASVQGTRILVAKPLL